MPMTKQSFLSLGPSGFHRIAYTDWGEPSAPHVVICVHGLSRNSRDFDFLARALESDCRVVCWNRTCCDPTRSRGCRRSPTCASSSSKVWVTRRR
jgi:pimeloyl-ACP methyl ester carboxylesterase